MQTRSSTYQTLIANSLHYYEWKIVINGTTYGMDKIAASGAGASEPKITRSLFSGSQPEVGACVAGQFSCSIYEASSNVPRMATVQPYFRVCANSQSSEWLSGGVFYIDTRTVDDTTGVLTLDCYDAMLKADGNSYADLTAFTTWPQTMTAVATEIASLMGVTLDTRTSLLTGSGFYVDYPNDLTMREVLSYIAGANGGNWTITPSGQLRLVSILGNSDSVSVGLAAKEISFSPAFSAWSKVTVLVDDDTEYSAGTTTGRELECEDPWAVSATATSLLAQISGGIYSPFYASGVYMDLAVELGDAVSIGSTPTQSHIYKITTLCSQGGTSDIEAPADEEVDHEYPYVSASNRAIQRKVTLNKSYYGTTISRSTGLEIAKTDPAGDPFFPSSSQFPSSSLFPGCQTAEVKHTRVVLNSDTLAFYGEDGTTDFYWDNTSKHFKLTALTTEVNRATGAEETLEAAIEVNSGAIESEVSARQSADSLRVLTSELDTKIGQYVDSASGSAKIISAVSGTYLTQTDAASTYATVTRAASIEASVEADEAKIALVVSSDDTINTAGIVTAINNSGSSVKINADKVDITGTVKFLTPDDVGASGSTVIDGSRITTGTIEAERITLKSTTTYGTGSTLGSELSGAASSGALSAIYTLNNTYKITRTALSETQIETPKLVGGTIIGSTFYGNSFNILPENASLPSSTPSGLNIFGNYGSSGNYHFLSIEYHNLDDPYTQIHSPASGSVWIGHATRGYVKLLGDTRVDSNIVGTSLPTFTAIEQGRIFLKLPS